MMHAIGNGDQMSINQITSYVGKRKLPPLPVANRNVCARSGVWEVPLEGRRGGVFQSLTQCNREGGRKMTIYEQMFMNVRENMPEDA